MRPNVRQLEAFKAVMDRGTVSAAARSLNVSQPAITKSIRLLEQQLKLRLFVRFEGRLVPSLEAKCLIGPVTKAFDDFAIVSELARELGKGDAGTFRIAATFGHSHAFLPDAVVRFGKSHPAVDFKVLTLRPDQIVELVAEHEVDLGIVYQPVDHRFREIALCETDVVCVVPRHHRLANASSISSSDLKEEKIISYVEQSHTGGLLKRRCEQAKAAWAVSITVNQTSTALSMVEAGLGVAVIDSLWAGKSDSRHFEVRPFLPQCTLTSRIIYAVDRPFSKLYKEFTQALSATVKDRVKNSPDLFRVPSPGAM